MCNQLQFWVNESVWYVSKEKLFMKEEEVLLSFLYPVQIPTSLASLILVRMDYLASAVHLLPCSL